MKKSYWNDNKVSELANDRHNGLYDLYVILGVILFFLFYWIKAIWATNFSVMFLYFVCIYVQFKEKRYGTFFFYLTFFLFLLDTVFFGLFDPSLKYKFIKEEIEYHALLCLALAIVGVYIGSVSRLKCKIGLGKYKNHYREDNIGNEEIVSVRMRSFLKWAFLFCAVFSLIEAVVKAAFVRATSYVAYYSDFTTPLPYFMIWLSSISPIFFYLYLGTLPKKKEANFPIVVYLLIGIVSLFYGQRNVFVVRTIVIICYFMVRDKNSDDEVWLSKRHLGFLIAMIPIGIFFMTFWNSVRFEEEFKRTSFFQTLINSLLEQGNDISIIDFEYLYRDSLPARPYAIGGIISTLHNNIIAQILGVQQIPTKANTVETALNGYAFSCSLMYIQNRPRYLMGFGIGSCYIAELVFSFGYPGIVAGSIIYGLVLKKLSEANVRGYVTNGIGLLMYQMLLLAPRASYDGFITSVIQVSTLFVLLLCCFFNRYVWPVRHDG